MLQKRIQDIKKGDMFKVKGLILQAQESSHQNFDEPDEPWIVYDMEGNSWFEEDIDNE